MSSLAKAWDFVWGTLLVGMVPMFAFCLILILSDSIGRKSDAGVVYRFLESALLVATFVVPFATLYGVCRWRQKHRLLPVSFLPVEIVLGLLLAGGAFFLTVFFLGMASLD